MASAWLLMINEQGVRVSNILFQQKTSCLASATLIDHEHAVQRALPASYRPSAASVIELSRAMLSPIIPSVEALVRRPR